MYININILHEAARVFAAAAPLLIVKLKFWCLMNASTALLYIQYIYILFVAWQLIIKFYCPTFIRNLFHPVSLSRCADVSGDEVVT